MSRKKNSEIFEKMQNHFLVFQKLIFKKVQIFMNKHAFEKKEKTIYGQNGLRYIAQI